MKKMQQIICKVCGKSFDSKRDDAQFCSSTCRSKKSRNATDNLSVATDNATDNVQQCSTLTKDELYTRIEFYPQDTWKDSPEFAELMKRLKEMSIEELEAKGYSVPNWKRSKEK